MEIKLIAGDNDWSTEGHHICNENGFALVLTEEKTINVSSEVYNRILPIIQDCRVFRGLNPDGTVPVPPPEPMVEPESEPVNEPT